MPVPFIDLKRYEPGFLDRWEKKSAEVARNAMFISGPEASALEERLCRDSGATAAVACANGTDALQLALRALGVGPGDKVLIPDATFWATFEAVVNVGAQPVTVDIDLDDLQMDFDLFVEAVEKYKPKAAILVHLYGWGSARLRDFRSYCRERSLPLIEDGAQCYGVTYNGESLYREALVSTVSFYPAKVLGSCGDAGALFCSTQELADTIRRLGNHGRSTHYGHTEVGWNSRIGGYDAAWLNLSLSYLDERLFSRREVAETYRERFDELGVRYVGPPEDYVENGYLSVALIDPARRPSVEKVLKENGIGFGNVYPGSMSQQPAAKDWLAGKVGGDNAEWLSRSVLNLPLFAYMRDEEVEEVLSAFETAIQTSH